MNTYTILKSLENGPKLMIITVQNRQHYAEKVYHFYLVRVETPPPTVGQVPAMNIFENPENRPKMTENHVF